MQRRRASRNGRVALGQGCLWIMALAGLCACSEMQVTESTPQAVTVHYYGVFSASLEDVTAAARKACWSYGKTTHLRKVDDITTMEHFAHFDCVSG